MRGHRGGDFLPGDISDELGTTLENWGTKLPKESPSGRSSQSQQSVQASPWGYEGSEEAGPRAPLSRAFTEAWLKGPFVHCSDFCKEFSTPGSSIISILRDLGLLQPHAVALRASHPLFTRTPDSSHHTMGSLKGVAQAPG